MTTAIAVIADKDITTIDSGFPAFRSFSIGGQTLSIATTTMFLVNLNRLQPQSRRRWLFSATGIVGPFPCVHVRVLDSIPQLMPKFN